jgi:hypothetical protein
VVALVSGILYSTVVMAAGLPPDPPANEDPANHAQGVVAQPMLCVDVSDPEGDTLDVVFRGRHALAEPFTVVALPDTQFYSESYPEIFEAQTQWIVDNRAARNIVFVTHLGDLVQNGSEGNDLEWGRADVAMGLLEDPHTTGLTDGIPYGVAPGNHDQTALGFPRSGPDEGATTRQYNETFGVHRFEGRGYYATPYRFDEPSAYADNNDNARYRFSAGGMDFQVLQLEFDVLDCPERKTTNAWVDRLLGLHPTTRTILASHFLLYLDGTFPNQGQTLYDVLKRHENPGLMVCGHEHGAARRTDEYYGNVVHTMLSDYQEETNGGNGWLRILTFVPESDEIRVETYSPWLDQFLTDADNEFTLSYEMPDGPDLGNVGEVFAVESGGRACVPWAGRRAGGRYEWFVEVSDGTSITNGGPWSFESDGTCGGNDECVDEDTCTEDACSGSVCSGTHPGDPDGDGICEQADNCPGLANHAQADRDGDSFGDRCDVCPDHHDSGQEDGDADGAGDACDGQPSDPWDRTPPEVSALRWARSGAGDLTLVWNPSPGADAYSVSRGPLSELGTDAYGPCLAEGRLDSLYLDSEDPAPGDGFFYLVQGQSFDGGLGPLGSDGAGAARHNLDPLACAGHVHHDARAASEETIYGTVNGSHMDTQASDDAYESITEELSGGGPSSRYSRLEHRWTFDVTGGSVVELHLEGYRSDSPDDDNFELEYSTDGGATWQPASLSNLPRTDNGIDLVSRLPEGISGTVVFRVIDTDRTAGHADLDSVHVDDLFVRSVP